VALRGRRCSSPGRDGEPSLISRDRRSTAASRKPAAAGSTYVFCPRTRRPAAAGLLVLAEPRLAGQWLPTGSK
jgi:hypothetical protein